MDKLVVNGGHKIKGELKVSGAKNSVLPVLAATVLNGKTNVIHDIPKLSDVEVMTKILRSVGCNVKRENGTVVVDSSQLNNHKVPEELVREMRSSIIVLGAMLARCGEAIVSYPGGCELGPRPIDLHLKSLREMGVEIEEKHGFLICKAKDGLKSTEIHLDFPSVGATENIMLAAVFAEGVTIIRNAAREPEIQDLQNFINAMGGRVSGAGSATIAVHGAKELQDVEHTIIPDRIVAGTYLIAAAMTKGKILLENVVPEHLLSTIYKLRESGCKVEYTNDRIKLIAPERLSAIEGIKTLPYPGFPTDMQSQIMSLLAVSDGISIITENIFENRYKHAYELVRMGANIKIDGRVAIIKGVPKLTGANVTAKDLRGGAALILAGLVAEGKTIIHDTKHIERGYDHIEDALRTVGADISKI